MNRAKSTRRVMLLSRTGSPPWRLHTGRPSLSPSSRSLPRTTVQRVSLAKMRRVASTWSSRLPQPEDRAQQLDLRPERPRVVVLAVAGDVPTAREHEPRAGLCVVEHGFSGAGGVTVHAPFPGAPRGVAAGRPLAAPGSAVLSADTP